ncbi:MAG: phasin family protein [Methylocella sp.]
MANEFDDVQTYGKEQFGAAAAATTCFAKTLQTIATETADYSKKALENNSAFVEKLLGAKSYETAIQIQSEYWKTSYAGFVAQATKIGELYSGLAKEALKPVETAVTAVTKVYNGKI